MKVVSVRGQNLYDLSDEHANVQVFELPSRLRHVVFVKPGNYVFARVDNTRAQGAIKGDIEVVILDRFLNSLQKSDSWPASFKPKTHVKRIEPSTSSPAAPSLSISQTLIDVDDDGEQDMGDWVAAGNPNRASWTRFQQSSDDEVDN